MPTGRLVVWKRDAGVPAQPGERLVKNLSCPLVCDTEVGGDLLHRSFPAVFETEPQLDRTAPTRPIVEARQQASNFVAAFLLIRGRRPRFTLILKFDGGAVGVEWELLKAVSAKPCLRPLDDLGSRQTAQRQEHAAALWLEHAGGNEQANARLLHQIFSREPAATIERISDFVREANMLLDSNGRSCRFANGDCGVCHDGLPRGCAAMRRIVPTPSHS